MVENGRFFWDPKDPHYKEREKIAKKPISFFGNFRFF